MKWGKKGKVPVQCAWVGRAGSLPPPPAPLVELWGGGEGWRAGSCLGIFEQGRGDLWQASRELKWQIFLASKFGGLFSRMNPAGFHSKIFWWVILAHLFGGSFWRIYLAGFHGQ
jgi:hypothetical protein